MAGSSMSPCAACKLLRRRCTRDCVFAPYFPPDEPQKFASVHKVFGAANVSKMLQVWRLSITLVTFYSLDSYAVLCTHIFLSQRSSATIVLISPNHLSPLTMSKTYWHFPFRTHLQVCCARTYTSLGWSQFSTKHFSNLCLFEINLPFEITLPFELGSQTQASWMSRNVS